MRNKYLETIAMFMILLIVAIPFYVSDVYAINNNELSKATGMVTEGNGDSTGDYTDAGQSCIEKKEKTHAFVEFLDNDVIGLLESVASIAFLICTIMSTIDIVINVITSIIGGNACCRIPAHMSMGHGALSGLYVPCRHQDIVSSG